MQNEMLNDKRTSFFERTENGESLTKIKNRGSDSWFAWIRKGLIGVVLSGFLFGSAVTPAKADTPAAAIAISFTVGVVSSLVASAIYDYATSDTTTTTTTTTTDSEGNTSTTTETTTEQLTGTPPSTPDFINIGGTVVRGFENDKTVGLMIGKTSDNADVQKATKKISAVGYKVQRAIKTTLNRTDKFPRNTSQVPLNFNFDEILVSTRDIPKTNGTSKMTVTVSVNGEVLYSFNASVEQGKCPSSATPKPALRRSKTKATAS